MANSTLCICIPKSVLVFNKGGRDFHFMQPVAAAPLHLLICLAVLLYYAVEPVQSPPPLTSGLTEVFLMSDQIV